MSAETLPKLLVLTSSFPRWDNDPDPRFVAELAFELARLFDVTVLAPHCAGAARHETLERDGARVDVRRYRYAPATLETLAYDGGIMAKMRRNPLRGLLVPLFLVGQLRALAKLHREKSFDLLHAHWLIPQGIVAAIYRRWSRSAPPFLVTAHGSDISALQGPIATRIKRRVLASATHTSVVSAALRAECEALGCEPGKITVAPMGVDLETTFTPPDDGQSRQGIVFVGKLARYKGADTLVEATGMLGDEHADVRVEIIGAGIERPALEQRVNELGLADRVHFAGALPQERLPGHLRSAAIAVVPSRREGLGLVVVEALGCGCAVVASDLPAIRDVITDGQTGLLAKPGNAGDLAVKLGRLLGDASLRARLAAAGRAHALERFDWRPAGERYANLLSTLIND